MTHEDQSLSVLIVEDDRDGRRLFVEWLEQAGFRVAQAHNGLQALERAVENTPDVVVTDLNIPGIDGFEATRRLKRDSRTRDVPVLAVTGYAAFTADPGRARRAGCDAVLQKPCSAEDLETAIRRLVGDPPRTRQVYVPRVILVEDHADTRLMYAEFLSSDFEVIQAADGEEALRAMHAHVPDLVITDLTLPGVNGFELVTRMRADPALAAVPVICLSGYGGSAQVDRAREVGCDRLIEKPCLPDTLSEAALEVLRAHKQPRQDA